MSRLLGGLSDMLKPAEPSVEEEQSIAAMDAAMQEAIDRLEAEKATAAGDESSIQPTVSPLKGPRSTFGLRKG